MVILVDIVVYACAALRVLFVRRFHCEACGNYMKPVVGTWQRGLFRCDNCQHYVLAKAKFPWPLATALAGAVLALA